MICKTIGWLQKLVIPVSMFVWSLHAPLAAASVFLAVTVIIHGYFRLLEILRPTRNLDPARFSQNERDTIDEYYVALRFPSVARDAAGVLSTIAVSYVIWVPWMLYRHLWFHAGAMVVYYFVSSRLIIRLNPGYGLPRLVGKGDGRFERAYRALLELEGKYGAGWLRRGLS